MRKTIFIGFTLLGAALGLFSSMSESAGVQVVMATVGAVAGVAIGGALSRVGLRRRARYVSPMIDSSRATEDRVSNYWLDHGRLTAAPGLPDPDATDQISLKP
jgi:Na+/glutamate symporter